MSRHCVYRLCVFFFKQKTAYERRISDWSSDVCSSDLQDLQVAQRSNSSRCPCGSPMMRSPSHTSWPLTQVEAMREWNVVPSNGDHAHFDSTSSRRTVNGVSSTSARSAQ